VGNPHSDHAFGWRAAEAVDEAVAAVADLIGADPGEVVVTSGATEANNLAVRGVARSPGRRGDHVVVTAIEHKCVLDTALSLRRDGLRVDVVPVEPDGIVAVERVAAALTGETTLVSVMLANNEVGTLQPVAEVAALCRARGIVCHTDAAAGPDHAPSTARIRRRSSAVGSEDGTLRLRPPASPTSTTSRARSGSGAAVARRSGAWGAATSTGTKPTMSRPASIDRPSPPSSARHW
jgi:hypothetical protein